MSPSQKFIGKCAGNDEGDMAGNHAYGRADNKIIGTEGRGARDGEFSGGGFGLGFTMLSSKRV